MNNDRFTSLDNSSPIVDPLKSTKIDVPRSSFNFSCMKYMNGMFGAIMPFDVIRTLPDEDYNISYDILAKLRNPLVRPLLTGCRIYVHTYYNRCSDLWEGSDNFFTKGRSGNINLEIPYLLNNISYKGQQNTFSPLAPSSYMGLPVCYYDSTKSAIDGYMPVTVNDTNSVYKVPDKINALPFVMYARLARDKYFPKNLLYNNTNIYPDNENHFILPYSATGVCTLDYNQPQNTNFVAEKNLSIPSNDNEWKMCLNTLYFRQFKGDEFNTSSPFRDLIRGSDIPTINISDIDVNVETSLVVPTLQNLDTYSMRSLTANSSPTEFKINAINKTTTGNESTSSPRPGWNIQEWDADGSTVNSTDQSIYVRGSDLQSQLKKITANSVASGVVNGVINLNDLRALEAYTIFMERNARTDGDYNNLIKAQFGVSPHVRNHEAEYIGGTYQDMVFSDVTQVSQSSEDSPLGSRAGQGISASSGYIGKFHSPDYGYIMSVMTIIPDTVYTQGVDRMWTELSQSEQYFPVLNNLSPQPTLNQQLYCDGTSDSDIFGWTERYQSYKVRSNKALNYISLPIDKASYDTAQIMARRFDSMPTLSADFVTCSPDNVDMSPFSVIDEPPFDISVCCRVDKVSPMPYITVPGGLNARA